MSRTRLDRLVWLRERDEESALAGLGRAREALAAAEERRRAREEAARADARRAGDAALWALDDGARRRALQALGAVEKEVSAAAAAVEAARVAWTRAHQETEAARRIAERRRAEAKLEDERRERRAADEVAALRHGRGG